MALADREAREPRFVELGRFCELTLGHPAGCAHAVLCEDAFDRAAQKSEVSTNRTNVANGQVLVNELSYSSGSELTSTLRPKATFHGASRSRRAEEQVSRCGDFRRGVRVNLQQVHFARLWASWTREGHCLPRRACDFRSLAATQQLGRPGFFGEGQ